MVEPFGSDHPSSVFAAALAVTSRPRDTQELPSTKPPMDFQPMMIGLRGFAVARSSSALIFGQFSQFTWLPRLIMWVVYVAVVMSLEFVVLDLLPKLCVRLIGKRSVNEGHAA